jgi:predicted transcriptional regulator
MKTKKSGKKINLLVKRISSLLQKGDKNLSKQSTEKVKSLQTEIETTLGLNQEIKALKATLKNRKKDLANGVDNLKKESKKVLKDLKSERKEAKKSAKKIANAPVKVKKAPKEPVKAEVPAAPKVKRSRTKTKPVKQ